MLAMTTWPDVAIALIAAAPAIIAAVYARQTARSTKMANGSQLGDVVTATHDLAASNAERIARVDNGVAKVVEVTTGEHA